jgi:hypothetical protein
VRGRLARSPRLRKRTKRISAEKEEEESERGNTNVEEDEVSSGFEGRNRVLSERLLVDELRKRSAEGHPCHKKQRRQRRSK